MADLEGMTNTMAKYHMTTREHDVLKHLWNGLQYKEIAHAMGVSSKTVDAHFASIHKKMNVQNIAQVLRAALNDGWISLP